jgi:mannose-1-phosphate guanylyltransferase
VKAILLAAGEGRRLRPVTGSLPKCLVPIQGVPLLSIWFRLLEQAQVDEVLLNLHYGHRAVEEFLDSTPSSLSVTTTYEERLLGSAGTVIANRDFVDGESSFLILYADNLTNIDLRRMVAFHETRTECLTIGVAPTDKPAEKGTVVVDENGRVLSFHEKAPQPRSNLANAGIYIARQQIFDRFPAWTPGGDALDFGHHVLPRIVPDIAAYPIEEFLVDIGTPENYERGQVAWPGLPAARHSDSHPGMISTTRR